MAISSTSSSIGLWVIPGSGSVARTVVWAEVNTGDAILPVPSGTTNASALSAGLTPYSHATVDGRFEFRISNSSSVTQSQSTRTWCFNRLYLS